MNNEEALIEASSPVPNDEYEEIRQRFKARLESGYQPDYLDPSSVPQSAEEGSVLDTVWEGAKTVGNNLREIPKAIPRGILRAGNEAADFAYSVATASYKFGKEAPNGWFSFILGKSNENPFRIPDEFIGESETLTGQLTEGLSQFAAGMFAGGAFLKGLGYGIRAATGSSKVLNFARSQGALPTITKAGIGDAVFFDPHEERLSNLIEQHTSFGNVVTEYLAASPDDSEAEGRFKNLLEGMLLGIPTEVVFHLVRSIKFKNAGKLDEAVDEIEAAQEAHKKAEEAKQKAEEGQPTGEAEKAASEAPRADDGQLNFDFGGTGGPADDSVRKTFGDADGNFKPEEALAGEVGSKPSATVNVPPPKKIIEIDDAALEADLLKRLELEGNPNPREISGLRTDLIDTDEELATTVAAIAANHKRAFDKAIGGNADNVRTFERVKKNAAEFAELIGDNPEILFQRMQAQAQNLHHMDAEMLAYRDIMKTVHMKLRDIARIVADTSVPLGKYATRDELLEDFGRHWELLANLQLHYKGLQTNIARSLNAMRLTAEVRSGKITDVNPEQLWRGGKGEDAVRGLAQQILATGDDLFNAAKLTRRPFAARVLDAVSEYFINSLLSSPKTHVANILGGILQTSTMPLRRMLAGAFQADGAAVREGFDMYASIAASAADALELAWRSFKTAEPILDSGHVGTPVTRAISSENLNITSDVGKMVVDGLFGPLVRLSSRFMTAEDELFKQLNYRAYVRAEALREARAIPELQNDPKAFAAYVKERMDKATEGGSAFDAKGRVLHEKALKYAREATFTQSLKTSTWFGAKSLGEVVQDGLVNVPPLRLIVPFVRTPTNIARFTFDHIPVIGMVRKQMFDDLRGVNGAEARAEAAAKQALGGIVMTTAATLAFQGKLTGGGPSDPQLRKTLEDSTDWRPYSFVWERSDGTRQYISFQRIEPFGSILGLIADAFEVSGHLQEKEWEEIALMTSLAVTKNFNSRTYLQGLVNVFAALSDPDRKAEAFLKNLAAGFVPSFFQVFNDPVIKEAHGIIQAMKRKIPGFNEELDPQRNLLGEKRYIPPGLGPDSISPIATGYNKSEFAPMSEQWRRTPSRDVHEELARQLIINDRHMRLPPKKVEGLDLTQYRSSVTGKTAYDRWQELTGTIKIQEKTLKEYLHDLINSEQYLNEMTDGNLETDGSRVEAIVSVIQGFRRAAFMQLLQEEPGLQKDYLDAKIKSAITKVSPDRAEQLKQQLGQE